MTKLRFVVHEHRAKRAGLHYALRLESAGALKDWAFRKAPPEEIGVKRFGIAREDHDKSWLAFEGEIKEGHGAGTLTIWDRGYCEIAKETSSSMVLRFFGNRLNGGVRTEAVQGRLAVLQSQSPVKTSGRNTCPASSSTTGNSSSEAGRKLEFLRTFRLM